MDNVTTMANVTLDLNETTSRGPTPLPATPPPLGYYGDTREMLWKVIPPIIMVVGTFGNVLTFLVLVRQKKKLSSTAMYLMALAVSDTIVLYTGPLRNWLAEMWDYDIRYMSDAGCKIQLYITYASLHCSSWLLVAVTLERALSVVLPHKVRLGCTPRTAGLVILSIFIFTYGLNIVNLVIYGSDAYRSTQKCAPTSKEYLEFRDDVFQWIDFLVAFAIPFVILLGGNLIIIVYLQRSRASRRKMAATSRQGGTSSGRSTKSVSVLMVALCAIFFLTMTPASIFNVYFPHKQDKIFELFAVDPVAAWYDYQFAMYQHAIVNLVSYTNASFNFILYVFSGSKFRKELRAMFFCDTAGTAGVFGSKTTKSSGKTGTTSLSTTRAQKSKQDMASVNNHVVNSSALADPTSNGVTDYKDRMAYNKAELADDNLAETKVVPENSSLSKNTDPGNTIADNKINNDKEKGTNESESTSEHNSTKELTKDANLSETSMAGNENLHEDRGETSPNDVHLNLQN